MPALPARHRSRFSPDEPCLNCGDTTRGDYCPTCGQARRNVVVSVGALVADVLEDQLMLGRALPRTTKTLFLRPGVLTREFLDGRRVRYIAPFRLYLASSVVFFLLFATFGLRGMSAPEQAPETPPPATAGPLAPTPTSGDGAQAGPREVQSWANTLEINIGSAETNARVRQRTIDRFGHLPFAVAMRAFTLEYLRYAPRVVFLLLPLFALILKLLYLRSGRVYVEHFVFSLHIHSFAFATATVALLLGVRLGGVVLGLSLLGYTWMALRTVYGQSAVWTSLKTVALAGAYSFFVSIAFLATVVLTLLRL